MASRRQTTVFVPGLLSDSAVWQAVADGMSALARVVNLGVSDGKSITDMARSALDSVTGPLVVAGHSMGARVAMEMARLAPERIRRLVLANTGVHARKPGEEVQRQTLIDLAYAKGMSASRIYS